MSTVERAAELAVPDFYEAESERDRDSVIQEMQVVAPEGLQEIEAERLSQLRNLTAELVAVDGARAAQEYDRYNNTKERRLDLPEVEMREWLADKHVLVTGGTGLIGSSLLSEISGYGVAGMTSVSRGSMEPVNTVDGVDYRHADIRDADALKTIMTEVKPDIVFHVAADKYNAEAEKRARHTLSTNILGTENVIAAAQEAGVGQLVYASTGKSTRPYSPDIYASSKKTGEWLVSEAARDTDMVCSAVRFTHVVDHSNVRAQINRAIDSDAMITIQSPEVMMYVQSGIESAQLLLNSGLETQLSANDEVMKVHTIRNLGSPINLPDLAIGALAQRGRNTPIYFTGVRPGYEDKAWFALYDPLNGGDVSPLINSLEAKDVDLSKTCPDVDVFPLEIATTQAMRSDLDALRDACADIDSGDLRELNQQLAWSMLDGRLRSLNYDVLARAAQRVERQRSYGLEMPMDHEQLNDAILTAYQRSLAE